MPVLYADLGIGVSVLHTRQHASLFDVSHMLQTRISGRDQIAFMERLTVADLQSMVPDHSSLTVFTNGKGGVVDDAIVNRQHDHLYLVSNAGCADKDWAHLTDHAHRFRSAGRQVDVTRIEDTSLLALQGPAAAGHLAALAGLDSLDDMKFMTTRPLTLATISCRVSRSGYTGEDGFEIQVPSNRAQELAERLLALDQVRWAGLGARDTLRLEAAMCLYGHDLNDEITPVEAGLAWTIGKRRKESGGFLGDAVILPQLIQGPKRCRVGLIVEGAPAREGAPVVDPVSGSTVGVVTSGCPSPTLKKNIAMAYVQSGHHKAGHTLTVLVRGKQQPAVVTKMPFVPARYHK